MNDEEMEEALQDGMVTCEDGCVVELDGSCPHGYDSPLLEAGLI